VNILAELAALLAFRDCPPELLKEFARAAPAVRLPAHALVFTQGAEASGALLIVSGWCRSEVQSGDRRIVLGRAGPGEMIGETGLYTEGMQRSATVVAEEELVAIKLERTILDDPRAAAALRIVELRALVTLSDRIRKNTASMTRYDEPGPTDEPDSFMSGLLRTFRRLTGS